MSQVIVRREQPLPELSLVGLGSGAPSEVYLLLEDGAPRWQVGVGWSPVAGFREELIWPAAGVVALGGGDEAFFLDLSTGRLRLRMPVRGYFGHLARVEAPELLLVLGCSDVLAFAPTLDLAWKAEGVAVDGITFGGLEGSTLHVNAEMDPPGGWFEVDLDVHSGRELARRPAFTEGYVGLYGSRD